MSRRFWKGTVEIVTVEERSMHQETCDRCGTKSEEAVREPGRLGEFPGWGSYLHNDGDNPFDEQKYIGLCPACCELLNKWVEDYE